MFDRLQRKWGVSGLRFVLIFCIFAIGGSLTGYLAKLIMPFLSIPNGFFYWVVYIIIVTCLWPVCILLVSLPLGQLRFFWEYEKKLGRWITGKNRKGIDK